MSQTDIGFICLIVVIALGVYLIMKNQNDKTRIILKEIWSKNTDDKACSKCGNPHPIITSDGKCECDVCGNKWEL